jgi:hypothetical protein
MEVLLFWKCMPELYMTDDDSDACTHYDVLLPKTNYFMRSIMAGHYGIELPKDLFGQGLTACGKRKEREITLGELCEDKSFWSQKGTGLVCLRNETTDPVIRHCFAFSSNGTLQGTVFSDRPRSETRATAEAP